jgi:leader peptidase (prepilin peptidase)/N-methyltransferase
MFDTVSTLGNALARTPAWLWLPPAAAAALAAWLGACFGSFSNVLIYRLPRDLSVVGPRSFCPSCRRTVAWYDNVPLASWLILRGRCRHCGARISARYLAVEALGAGCALAGLALFGWTPSGLAAAVYLLLLGNIAIIDWQHMIIPHTLTVTGMITGLLFAFFRPPELPAALLGLVVGAVTVLAVSWGYKLLRGVVGMGGGDVMLMAMVGAYQGPWAVPAVLFGGAFMGTLYAVVAGRGRVAGAAKLPFGTFLAVAAVVVLVWGKAIWAWYRGFLGG